MSTNVTSGIYICKTYPSQGRNCGFWMACLTTRQKKMHHWLLCSWIILCESGDIPKLVGYLRNSWHSKLTVIKTNIISYDSAHLLIRIHLQFWKKRFKKTKLIAKNFHVLALHLSRLIVTPAYNKAEIGCLQPNHIVPRYVEPLKFPGTWDSGLQKKLLVIIPLNIFKAKLVSLIPKFTILIFLLRPGA